MLLNAIDDAIERSEAVIAATEELQRSLLHELLSRGVPGWYSEWREVRGLGVVPACWEVVRLGEVFDILDSKRVPLNVDERAEMSGPYPHYGANGVVDHIDRWLFDDELVLPAEDGGNFEDFAQRPITYRVRGKCWVNNHAHVLKARQDHMRSFLFHSLVHKDIRGFINGSTRSKLTQGDLRQILIGLPRESAEAAQIGMAVDAVDEAIQEARRGTDVLRSLKASASEALLSGRVRIPA